MNKLIDEVVNSDPKDKEKKIKKIVHKLTPETNMTAQDIKVKIEKAEKNKFMTGTLKEKFISKLKTELVEAEAKEAKPFAEPASAPTKKEKKASKSAKEKQPAEPKPKKKKAKKEPTVFMFEGKEIKEGDVDYCEKLLAAHQTRREKAKKASKKYRTEPVISKIAGDITDAVVKGAQSVAAANIKKNPTSFKKKVKELESAAKSFITAFKGLLGSDYKKGEIDPEFNQLETLLDKLIKKYSGKTMEEGGIVADPTYNEVIDWAAEQGLNTDTPENFKEAEEAYKNNLRAEDAYMESHVSSQQDPVEMVTDLAKAVKIAIDAHHKGIHVSEMPLDKFEDQIKEKVGADHSSEDIKLAYEALKEGNFATGGRLKRKDRNKIHKVMHEFKNGELKTSQGKKVIKRRQAIAIAMSEAGLSKKK